jgi:lipid A 3-O-deacylase
MRHRDRGSVAPLLHISPRIPIKHGMKILFALPVALLGCSLVHAQARAQAQAQTAPAPLNDPAGILTITEENDAFSVPGTDRYYTNGTSFSYVTPTGALPEFLANFGHNLIGPGSQRLEFDLQQVIYTPVDTQAYNPNPDDRPYAGQLTLHTTLIQDTDTTRTLAQVSFGLVGGAALGQPVQNGFHSLIGDTPSNGWHHQLHNEPTLDFLGARTWRYDLASFDGGAFGIQALPQATAQVGNSEIYAQAGGIVRIGSGLDSDYGPAVIEPVMTGTNAYTPTQPLVWYIFAGASGRLVAHDLLVQGNDFQSSRGVDLTPVQGDAEVGAAIIAFGVRLSATEIFTTSEFHHAAPAFQYGSIALSTRF